MTPSANALKWGSQKRDSGGLPIAALYFHALDNKTNIATRGEMIKHVETHYIAHYLILFIFSL